MKPPLIVIVGATGTGKTALAIELAKQFNGEIIAADSRTVYTGMDIGTAKPTVAERQGILHYGLDVVAPNEPFTAYDFQQLAYRAIDEITARGKLPIMVGGTGLYVDAVLYDFQFRKPADSSVRAALAGLSTQALQERVVANGMALPENAENRRHLMRLLESGPAPRQARVLRPETFVLGIQLPQTELQVRLTARAQAMVRAGLVDETRRLYGQYGNSEALRAPAYRAMISYIMGDVDLETTTAEIVKNDLALAKRQRTWFRRNHDIHWLDFESHQQRASELVSEFLHKGA